MGSREEDAFELPFQITADEIPKQVEFWWKTDNWRRMEPMRRLRVTKRSTSFEDNGNRDRAVGCQVAQGGNQGSDENVTSALWIELKVRRGNQPVIANLEINL